MEEAEILCDRIGIIHKGNLVARGSMEELRKIRENGYAFDLEERVVGVRCVAAPVFSSRNEVIGAIGISGMIQNMPPERMEAHAQVIKSIAEKVSINVGNDLLF